MRPPSLILRCNHAVKGDAKVQGDRKALVAPQGETPFPRR